MRCLKCCFAGEEEEQTVCIIQSSCVNVHTVTGKDFISPLPFQVSGTDGTISHFCLVSTYCIQYDTTSVHTYYASCLLRATF